MASISKRCVCNSIAITALVALFQAGPVAAQPAGGSEESFNTEVDSYIRYLPSRDAKAGDGKVGLIQAANTYEYEFKAFEKLPVTFSFETSYIGINNSTPVDLPAKLTGLTAGLETTFPFLKFDNAYVRIGVSPAFYTDNWSAYSSAFRMPVHSFVIYQPSEAWTFLLGVAVFPDFDTDVVPIIGCIYKYNDRLTVNIIPKRPNITYKVNEKMSLFAEGGGELVSEYEVKRGNQKGVILEFKESYVGGGIKYKLNRNIEACVTTGGVFNRALKYRDDQGKVSLKNGMFSEFRVIMNM